MSQPITSVSLHRLFVLYFEQIVYITLRFAINTYIVESNQKTFKFDEGRVLQVINSTSISISIALEAHFTIEILFLAFHYINIHIVGKRLTSLCVTSFFVLKKKNVLSTGCPCHSGNTTFPTDAI